MIDVKANNHILPVPGEGTYGVEEYWMEQHVAKLSISARMRFEKTPIWESMQSFWYEHFSKFTFDEMKSTLETLGLGVSPKMKKADLRDKLVSHFIWLTIEK